MPGEIFIGTGLVLIARYFERTAIEAPGVHMTALQTAAERTGEGGSSPAATSGAS